MGAAPVRVDRPTERHGGTGRDGVQGASGGHLVKADAGHVLGRDGTEDATHPSEAGQRVTVVGVDRLLLPAHDVDSNTCTYADQPRHADPSGKLNPGLPSGSTPNDGGVDVRGRRRPQGGIRRNLLARPDVLPLVRGAVGGAVRWEPDVRDAATFRVPDLLAELVRSRRHVAGDAP